MEINLSFILLFSNQLYDDEICFIHTSYTNKGLINYLHSLNIKTICVATGVKKLAKRSCSL